MPRISAIMHRGILLVMPYLHPYQGIFSTEIRAEDPPTLNLFWHSSTDRASQPRGNKNKVSIQNLFAEVFLLFAIEPWRNYAVSIYTKLRDYFCNIEMTGMVDKLTKMPANWAREHGFMYFKGKKTRNLKRFKLHPNCQGYPAKM